MFVASYTFVGNTDQLKAGHAKMLDTLGKDGMFMHVALEGDEQLTVLDACPSEAVFKEFSQGEFFRMLVDKCELPMPTIVGLGEVVDYVFEQQ